MGFLLCITEIYNISPFGLATLGQAVEPKMKITCALSETTILTALMIETAINMYNSSCCD